MFSRIIVGAHFLTDVTFGAMITLASFELAKFLANKFIKKVNLSNLIERSKPCLIEESINYRAKTHIKVRLNFLYIDH